MGYGLGLLLVALGALTYWLAPIVGPNPWFGMRTGYSVASRDVWNRSNRLGGLLFAACGLVECLITAALPALGLKAGDAATLLFGWLIAGALLATVAGFFYSRRLAMVTAQARDLKPVPFRWAYVAPVLVSAALLLVLAAWLYPQLPATHLATHFDAAGNANGWMDRDGFMATFLVLGAIFGLLDIAVVLWATREPLIAVDRLGDSWWMSPERGLAFMAGLMTFLNLFLGFLLWDTAIYNLTGAHAIPASLLIWIFVPILAAVVIGFFALAQRRRMTE
jgi:hypothetical protein